MVTIPTVTPTGTGATLLTYWQDLADTLGYRLSTTVSEEATVGEANRIVLADELRDDEQGYVPYGPMWLCVRQTDVMAATQRRVINQDGVGYQGNEGALMLSRPLDAALPTATVVDVTSPLPVRKIIGVDGLVECVNKALGRCKTLARVTLTGDGTNSASLASYPFITSTDDINGIYDTRGLPTGYAADLSPITARVVSNGVTRSLVTDLAYSSGETFYADVIVDADRLVADGSGVWAYVGENATRGLQEDDWQASVPLSWVRAFGMVMATREIAKLLRADRRMDIKEKEAALIENERNRQPWIRTANVISRTRFPRVIANSIQSLAASSTPAPAWP